MPRCRRHLICYLLCGAFASSFLSAQAITETDIYDAGPATIGNHPETSLIQASDGNLYGTMQNVETKTQYGISPNGVVSILHEFTNGVDGGQPQASLIEGPDGALYGTTSQGGSGYQAGTVFRLTLDGQLTTLFAFTGEANATAMNITLTYGSDGTLYGVSSKGGPQYSGVLFKMSPQGQFTDLFNFVDSNFYEYPAGEFPESPLLEYSSGNFVGTTSEYGGSSSDNTGTVFTISSTGEYDEIHQFHDPNGAPSGFLTIGSDNAMYGIGDGQSGANEGGIIYRISPEGSYSTIHFFAQGTEGNGPNGLFLGSDGRFYTTTFSGGVNGTGTIVAITTSGDVTVLHSFAAENINGNEDGNESVASLVQGSDGAFYGTTAAGGAHLDGMIFRLAFSPALPPPVELTLSTQSVAAGQPVDLSWRVANAFSTTMQQCYSFVQNNASGAGSWSGLQQGTISNGAYQGSTTITPTATGTFTYALTCGGIESGFATSNVTGSAKKSTSTSFSIGPNPIPNAGNVELFVKVSGPSGTPTGNVTFSAGELTLTTVPLANGSINVSFPVNPYPAGTYQVTATYQGDSNYASSISAPVTATILPARSATTVVLYDLDSFEAPLNSQINATAQIFSTLEDSDPSGFVNYYINGQSVGSASIGTGGFVDARIDLTGFSAGTYLLNASYPGDFANAPASAIPVVLYIGVSPDETFLGVSPITVSAPANETFTARIYNDNDDTFPVSGSVVFTTGNTVIGSAPVNSSGYATLTASTKGIPPGAYPVVATFQGNSKFGQSSSPAQTVTVK